MIKVLLYIVGFLIGLFIILNIVTFKDAIYESFTSKSKIMKNKTSIKSGASNTSGVQKSSITSSKNPTGSKPSDGVVMEGSKISEKMITQLLKITSSIQKPTQQQPTQQKPTQQQPTHAEIAKSTETKSLTKLQQFNLSNTEECNKPALLSFNTENILNKNELIALFSTYLPTNINDKQWKADNKIYNSNVKLLFNNNPIWVTFPLNPYVKGIDLNNNSIDGPYATLMIKRANKILKNFSLLFILKIKDFKDKYNYLFEMRCKPTLKYNENTQARKYIENSISITFVKQKNDAEKDTYNSLLDSKIYKIEIKIGSETFIIENINSSIFENDTTFIALIMKEKEAFFNLNELVYKFERKSTDDLELDTLPIKINDNKGCDCIIYSFAYYDTYICKYDIDSFRLYNTYYLYGSNKIDEEKNKLIIANADLVKQLKNV